MDSKVPGLHYENILQQFVKLALKTRRADSRITLLLLQGHLALLCSIPGFAKIDCLDCTLPGLQN
jgi:hypothetical protein